MARSILFDKWSKEIQKIPGEERDLEFGLTYLRHMIDQGFHVAYAVSEMEGGLVHLKAWENSDEESEDEETQEFSALSWPSDNQIIMFAIWEPMKAIL